ncbi:protein-L-isoaspartate(D-aspartate) O-methyltransferase [Desulfovibrio sp. OttesenSCG-928-F07]|nr:protein-L-isoaspartate(D-aspartate) O-methyltransferase [Desulfovibrio sp. OttesenSCG-928-F07]
MDYSVARNRMVNELIAEKPINSPAVIAALRKVPRHLFVDIHHTHAYSDKFFPIGEGQTISRPYIVALMSQSLNATPGMNVLEIGTGCGYQSAVLSEMGLNVFTIERLRPLYIATAKRFAKLGYYKIKQKLGDGTLGWPEQAPFDRIIVTAGGNSIPAPLIEQLADPGIMVIPVGVAQRRQELVVIRKQNGELLQEKITDVTFVDLIGDHGW